jgi:hypothetical protein
MRKLIRFRLIILAIIIPNDPSDKLAVTIVAFLANQGPLVHRVEMEPQEHLDAQVPQESRDGDQSSAGNQSSHLAGSAHQAGQDLTALQELKVTQEAPADQDLRATLASQANQDRQDLKDLQDRPAQLDPLVAQARTPGALRIFLETPAETETQDLKVHQAPVDNQETMDSPETQAIQDLRDRQAQLVFQAPQETMDREDPRDRTARGESARNIVRRTAASFSKTEPGDRLFSNNSINKNSDVNNYYNSFSTSTFFLLNFILVFRLPA